MHVTRSHQEQTMKGKRPEIAGAPGKAPLPGQRNPLCPAFLDPEMTAPRCTNCFVLATRQTRRPEFTRILRRQFQQRRFPNLPYRRLPNRPGVKRRPRWVWKPALQQARLANFAMPGFRCRSGARLLTTSVCRLPIAASGEFRRRAGKSLMRIADRSKGCASRMDRL